MEVNRAMVRMSRDWGRTLFETLTVVVSPYNHVRIRSSRKSLKYCYNFADRKERRIFMYRKEGYLYDKAAILQYIITKKKEASLQMKRFENEKKSEEKELTELAEAEKSDLVKNFVEQESTITTPNSARRNSFFIFFGGWKEHFGIENKATSI